MPANNKPFIITIGASAGGINAIQELVSHLAPQLNAAIFVVLHLSTTTLGDIFVNRIQKSTHLRCKLAEDNERIKPGIIYSAPPGAHLLVKEDRVVIGHGPPENRFRPSIDVLFRSAAVSHKERVIGIILTGFLNDGTAGMWAIKQSGGYCIVQDPNEAQYPDMPLAVLESMEVDETARLKDIGDLILLRTLKAGELKEKEVPENVIMESTLSEKSATGIEKVEPLGEKSLYACPDCGGGLWKIQNGNLSHYRCHIGHAYSEDDLVLRQAETIENTIWVAVRMMEERKTMLAKMARQNDEKGLKSLSSQYRKHADDLEEHIAKMKQLLLAITKD